MDYIYYCIYYFSPQGRATIDTRMKFPEITEIGEISFGSQINKYKLFIKTTSQFCKLKFEKSPLGKGKTW